MNWGKLKRTFIRQRGHSDCGVACLASIIKYYGGQPYLERLHETSGTTKQGSTLLGLQQAALSCGLNAEGLEAESIDNLKELKNPAILHVTIDSSLHYLVFYQFINKKGDEIALVGDPAKGLELLSKSELAKIWKTKSLLSLYPNNSFAKAKENRAIHNRWVYDLIKADSNALLSSLILGILISLLSLSTAIFSQKLLDEILPNHETQRFQLGLTLVFLVLFGRSILIYLRGFSIIKQAKDFNLRLVTLFFNRLLHLPKPFFDSRKVGELIARMNDTRRIQLAVSTITGNIIIDILLIIVSFGFVFSYSLVLGLFIASSAAFFGLLILLLSPKIATTQRDVMRHYALTEGFYVDAITGITQIKSGAKEFIFQELNKSIFQKFQKKQFELGTLGIKYGLFTEFISVIYIIGTIGISSIFVLSEQLSIGQMIAILSMVSNIVPSLTRIAASNIQFQEAKIAFERMFEFASLKPEQSGNDQGYQVKSIQELNVSSISYRFPGRPYLFKDISFRAKVGSITAIVGENGSGKSTLFSIIEKFYPCNEGIITIDNQNLSLLSVRAWRQSVGVVHQNVKIFNGSVAFNICYSNSKEDIERVEKMCKYYGFDNFFDRFPEKYDTVIGEEGINLSGGQKKMLAFARSLFNKPKILLIDELTSELDKNSEQFVMSILVKLKANIPIIMITHQPHIARIADNIYLLENGTITKNGRHEDLIQSENFYSKVYKSYTENSFLLT